MEKKVKKLKLFNGRGHGKFKNKHIYIAAHSVKHCAELLSEACGFNMTVNEINTYWHKGMWGNSMNGIEAVDPCVYVGEVFGTSKPVRII